MVTRKGSSRPLSPDMQEMYADRALGNPRRRAFILQQLMPCDLEQGAPGQKAIATAWQSPPEIGGDHIDPRQAPGHWVHFIR